MVVGCVVKGCGVKGATATRRRVSEADRERAEARRAAMRELAARVAAMDEGERVAMVSRLAPGGVCSIEGRAYSVRNALMLLFQREGVSVVGGFRQWLAAGRAVRKGERGLGVWAPAGGGDAEDEAGEGDSRRRFVLVTVFDIGQTEAIEGGA